ncbi:MAG: hypothetical protein M1839_004487 [Geoglossum umbratile]|nr:MAG: hypothetical protein M1839_004487 [Geoglossum umbratile]
MSSSVESTQPKSQYHHFVPRFILRNFSHPYKPPNSQSGFTKRGRRKPVNGYYVGDPMLHGINLANSTAEITETPVAKTFGQMDMYRDFAHSSNQHHIERQLSQLEARASEIISKIRKAFEAKATNIWVTRTDRDALRKFLFIMKYRGSLFYKRFRHQHIDDYKENDKEKLHRYMREKGFQKPVDVWFDNIKAILELKIATDFKWVDTIRNRIYPDDAEWFINNMQHFYLALCTPNSPDDEFLLTENAYSIYEGRDSYTFDPQTNQITLKCYTETHIFAPISPRLIFVLRNLLLPIPLEDQDEATRNQRQSMMDLTTVQHNHPDEGITMLEDLPITKARNSYSKVENGKLVTLDGKPHIPKCGDKFNFRFFPISSDHIGIINGVMLEESREISTIIFNSPRGARRALEFYLPMSCNGGFKGVTGAPDDPRLVCLKKLEQAAGLLGSSAVAVYKTVTPTRMSEDEILESLGKRLERDMPNVSIPSYAKLGGTPRAMFKDIDQSSKMLNMRIKTDVWSQGLSPEIREEIRERVRDLFCEYAMPRRVLLYLKDVRVMKTVGPEVWKSRDEGKFKGVEMGGAEDVIANASHLFRDAESMCQTMYQATLNKLLLTGDPDYGIRGPLTYDDEGGRRYQQERHLVFSPLGSICDCGIPRLSTLASIYRKTLLTTKPSFLPTNPLLTPSQNTEDCLRFLVRQDFYGAMMGVDFEGVDEGELEMVLFEVVYPAWGGRWKDDEEGMEERGAGLMGRMAVVVAVVLAVEWLAADR